MLDIINCGYSETFIFRLEGHTVSVSLKCSQTAFAISDDEHSTSSYEIDMPSECNLSIGSPFVFLNEASHQFTLVMDSLDF